MKKVFTLLTIAALLFIIAAPSTVQALEGPSLLKQPEGEPTQRAAVSLFKNTTGDPSLDWISWSLQNSIYTDLGYISAFEEYTSPYIWKTMADVQNQEKFLSAVSDRDWLEIDLGWIGEYRMDDDQVVIEARVMDIQAMTIVAKGQAESTIDKLPEKISEMVLEITKSLGKQVSRKERKRVLSIKTRSAEALKAHAIGYLNLFTSIIEKRPEDMADVEASLVDAIETDPDFAEGWADLGLYYLIRGETDKSIRTLETALGKKPFLITAIVGLAEANINQNDLPKAHNLLERAYSLNPSDSESAMGLLTIMENIKGKKQAKALAMELLQHPSPHQRKNGITFFAVLGDKAAFRFFIELLHDSDPGVSLAALYALGMNGNETVLPVLSEFLEGSDPTVRYSAVHAIGNIGGPEAAKLLLKALKDPDGNVRKTASRALMDIADQGITGQLVEMLQDENPSNRALAALILGEVGDRSAVSALEKVLEDSENYVRREAGLALVRLGSKAGVPLVLEMLRGAEGNLSPAAWVLKDLGDRSVVPDLIEALNQPEQKNWVIASAAVALGGIGDSTAIPALIRTLDNSSMWVRYWATDALGEIGDPEALSALVKVLSDEDTSVRMAAAESLGKIGDRATIPHLVKMLQDTERWAIRDAAAALGEFGGEEAFSALAVVLANDPDPVIRAEIPDILRKMDDDRISDLLAGALDDPEKSVRLHAAVALAKLGDPRAIPILRTVFIGSVGWKIQEEAIAAMAVLGDAKFIYGYLGHLSGIHIFREVRENIVFPEDFKAITDSEDPVVSARGHYLMSLQAREEGRYEDQLKQTETALKKIDPMNETALGIFSLWLESHAQLKLGKTKRALNTITEAEELLEYVSKKEREDNRDLFEEYTLYLKGEILSVADDKKSAVTAFEKALYLLERKEIRPSIGWFVSREKMAKLTAMVRTSLGILQVELGKENLTKAVERGRGYDTADSVQMESEEKRYIALARQRIAEGDYEGSQTLIEELSLRRTKYINRRMNLKLADPEKQMAVAGYRGIEGDIEDLSRRIEARAREVQGQGRTTVRGDEKLKELEVERNKKRRELKVYVTKLKRTHPDVAMLMGATPLELSRVQEKLPEDTVLLQYLLLTDRVVVFTIGAFDMDIVEIPVERAALEKRVRAFRKAVLSGAEGKSPKRTLKLGADLYEMLITPVEESGKLDGKKVVGIFPNAFLHQVPFGALVDSEGKYFVDRYDLFYVNSTSILGVAMQRGEGNTGERSLLALANPDGTLEYADAEVENISGRFGKKKVFSQGEAKRGVIESEISGYSVLHLSTHGVFDAVDSTRSYLLMSDGKVTVQEIWGFPLGGVDLAVLSACETGVGEVLSGDDVVSLENAFIFSGAPSVLATLWSVSDESTAVLMDSFYAEYLGGKGKAAALSSAQRSLKEKYEHPFFWSAFTLRGDWR